MGVETRWREISFQYQRVNVYKVFLRLGSHRKDEIHCLGQQHYIAPDSLSKVRRQSIPTSCNIQC